MDHWKKDQRRQKIFSKLDNDPNALKDKIQTLFKKGHWEGALNTLNRYVFYQCIKDKSITIEEMIYRNKRYFDINSLHFKSRNCRQY